MRYFLIPGHRVVSSGDFSLNDLSGSTGRLDILLRSVSSAFFLSNGIRKDTELCLVLLGDPSPPAAIKMVGSELRYLNPDERSTGALIRTALMRKRTDEWRKSTPGIYCARKNFETVVEEYAAKCDCVLYLKENGIKSVLPEKARNPLIVLGDQYDLTPEEEQVISAKNAVSLSLGPQSLHTHHCITIIHNILDKKDGCS